MGYDQDRFTCKFSIDLVCSICLCVLEDPIECKKCETNFCSECINSWKQRNNKCPNNCELILSKSHRFLRSFLDALTLKCINENTGCQEVLTLSQIKSHESAGCKYRIVKCKYPGCYGTFNSSEIEDHQQNCPKKIITCGDCGEEIKVAEMANHSCISLLSTKIESLIVKYSENSKKLEEIEKVCNDKVSTAKKETHFGIKCNSCLVDPIVGVRHVCLECLDYNLCWKCHGNDHNDHEFFQLATVDVHESVTCDECFASPIRGIRYKCKNCQDFGDF